MVFSANDALIFTNNQIVQAAAAEVQIEIGMAETEIRRATGLGLFNIVYNATVIGNPIGPPQISTNLTANQSTFYGLFVGAGYLVDLDDNTGRWFLNWAPVGPESQVSVYSLRTTITPTFISPATITLIETFFAGISPVVHVNVILSGTLNEADFGGTGTIFYEYTIVTDQEFNLTDFSAALKAMLITQGLGYLSGNCQIFKIV